MNWEQLKTILWLRARLARNQWRKTGGLGAVLAVIAAIGAILLGGLFFVGALLGAAYGLGKASPLLVMGIWFGLTVAFLFFWTIGLIAELQRAETIDLQRLMHLPVALGQMFVINYLASHFTMSVLIGLPAMTGLALGLAFARGPAMLLLLPLAWSMVFMVTAWSYCFSGWLAALMSNPRRRRSIIMGITLGFVLLGQAPNLYFNVLRRNNSSKPATPPKPVTTTTSTNDSPPLMPSAQTGSGQPDPAAFEAEGRKKINQLLAIQKFIPPLWVPVGAQGLAENRILPALLGTLGCVGIGALGLRRAYRSTVKFYQGETGALASARTAAPAPKSRPATRARVGDDFLELRLSKVPEQAAAMALATLRSMLRAPEVKMAWASSFIAIVIVGSTLFLRPAPNLPDAVKPFVVTGTLMFSLFMLVQFLANHFGFDRHGFRALVLSPADRRLILLGKNLATWPIGGTFGLILLVFLSVWLRLPTLAILAGFFQLVTLLLLGSLGGNLLSILVPYHVAAGSMKPTKLPALAMVVMVLCQLLFPLAMLPVFLPPLLELFWHLGGGTEMIPVNFLLSLLLAAGTAFVYWRTLEPLGRLLQRREMKILNIVTAQVE